MGRTKLDSMPLSEREQQILAEIEKDLGTEDPAFARKEREPAPEARGAKLGIVVIFTGILLLIGFFVSQLLLVGVAAFAAMVGGIVMIASSLRTVIRRGDGGRDRIQRMMTNWETRFRDRYKRR
jgi:Na+/H+ antiporter NhaD/arsenite permease-like protein